MRRACSRRLKTLCSCGLLPLLGIKRAVRLARDLLGVQANDAADHGASLLGGSSHGCATVRDLERWVLLACSTCFNLSRLDSKRQPRPVCCQGHQALAATHRGALHCHLEGPYGQEQTTCRLLHRPAAQLARLLMSAQCGPGALTHKVGTLER